MKRIGAFYIILLIVLGGTTVTTVVADQQIFTLSDNSGNLPVIMQNSNTGAGARTGFTAIRNSANVFDIAETQGEVWFRGFQNEPMDFYTNNALKMTITGSGNVGIGTSSPVGKLQVSAASGDMLLAGQSTSSSSFTEYALINDQGPSNRASLYFAGSAYSDANTPANGLVLVNSMNAPVTLATSNTARLTVTGSGNVGIGTSSPAEKLDVSGNIRLTGNIVSPNDICIGSC